uniref:Uncharacterized protein n=1 Tax=Psilocybe cubensis TaxID=181762 RepID=A0A8H7Y1Z5_PSICU
MVCNADNTQLCGAGNRLAVYVDSTAPALDLNTCLNNAQLQGGNVPQFKFTLEGRYVPAFPGAPVSVPGLLGNSPVPVGSNGLHLQILTGRSATQPHVYTLPIETVGAPEALLVNDLQGNGLGEAVQLVPGGQQFFDVGTFDNFVTGFNYCAQPNPFTASTYIGPPVLAVNLRSDVWAFCAAGLTYLKNATSEPCSDVLLAMTPPIN